LYRVSPFQMSCIKIKIISSSSSWDIFNESVNGRTNGRTDKVIAI
jgi:hypothetical protein